MKYGCLFGLLAVSFAATAAQFSGALLILLDLRNPSKDRWVEDQVDQLEKAFEQVLGLNA